ncbi:MAG: hypothetical protein KDE54_37845, partial [Caldilineaceae bacterium]|nr:hypothetical protein [Caldilineaceae bacterium]
IDACITVTEAGQYNLKGRFFGPDDARNSVFVQVDGLPLNAPTWHVPANASVYQDVYAPETFALNPGQHIITIYHREAGTRIDSLVLELIPATATPTATATPNGTVTSTPTSIPCNQGLVAEAESGARFGAFALVADAAASGGAAVEVPEIFGDFGVP